MARGIRSEKRVSWPSSPGMSTVCFTSATTLRDEADVRISFNTVGSEGQSTRSVHLPTGMPWPARWAPIDQAIRDSWPRASIVILTHDNLAFSRMCLTSVLENTEYPNYEVIVVDNASSDGTVEDLKSIAGTYPNIKLILNDDNAGFGPGNNQGLRAATGDILVLLNNDTIVPRGWLTRLGRHLEDANLGIIGPGTNRSCNEAQIDIPYQTYSQFQEVARS